MAEVGGADAGAGQLLPCSIIKPVDVTDPNVIEIAKSAVNMHNELAHTNLELDYVIGGVIIDKVPRVVSCYALLISAKENEDDKRVSEFLVKDTLCKKNLIWWHDYWRTLLVNTQSG